MHACAFMCMCHRERERERERQRQRDRERERVRQKEIEKKRQREPPEYFHTTLTQSVTTRPTAEGRKAETRNTNC